MSINVGFISTRFAGTDGVTLEASKWADVLERNGHRCHWLAGKLDRNSHKSLRVPEAHFQHELNSWINNRILGKKARKPHITRSIHRLRSMLKAKIHEFINTFDLDLLIAENVLSIPMHVPLGLALTEAVAETQIPTIAHHHDFHWERIRFSVNAVNDYLRMAFPPNLPNIRHVVINSEAQEQLALRTGIASTIIPNVLDFENPPSVDANAARQFRSAIGLNPGDRIILQPTRVIQRKGIEHAIELVNALADQRNKLVVSHEAGDEGFEYAEWLRDYACEHDVDFRLVDVKLADPLARFGCQRTQFSLWDIYPFADFITYPSLCEGFGNAFLEAVYFKKPILINRYATFVRDIEPLGFDLAVMDGYLSKKTVTKVKEILESPQRCRKMVDWNYRIAAKHFSYTELCRQLMAILSTFFGDAVNPFATGPPTSTPNAASATPRKVIYAQFNAPNG